MSTPALGHWVMDDVNTSTKLVQSRTGYHSIASLNASGTYSLVNTIHNRPGGIGKAKTLTATGLSANQQLFGAPAMGNFDPGDTFTVEAVFRLSNTAGFLLHFLNSSHSGTWFDMRVSSSSSADTMKIQPAAYNGGVGSFGADILLRNVFAIGAVRFGELCHLGISLYMGDVPRWTAFVNGEYMGTCDGPAALSADWGSDDTFLFQVKDSSGDASYTCFSELIIHKTPLTLGLARHRARYLRQMLRIEEI